MENRTGGDSGNKKKSLTTRSGCTITIDDDEGSITMKDKDGNSYAADGQGNITISASKSIKLCVGETSIELDSEAILHPMLLPISRKRPERTSSKPPKK